MTEAFKHRIDGALVRTIAAHVQRVWPEFPRRRFERQARAGLEQRELKARVTHVAEALEGSLPATFSEAATTLERSLAPARPDDDLSALVSSEQGLAGWAVWPLSEFVARRGLRSPQRALRALHRLTQRHTAEYALRPFLVEHPDVTMAALRRWVGDLSPHVRRLTSEGTRPRLPWGRQLRHLVEDPGPCLPLLEQLQDDPSSYVRRSVANHLNDISKDHPGVVVEWLRRHLRGASPARHATLRHAARTLIKQGDKRALRALGLGAPLRGDASLTIRPRGVRVGGWVSVEVALASGARRPQDLVVDYVVHHVKRDGSTRAKTWKGWRLHLAPEERRVLTKTHSLRPVTTRRDYPGVHRVDLLVNGDTLASAEFELCS